MPARVSFVACAAYCKPTLVPAPAKREPRLSPSFAAGTERKVHAILRTALDNGHDALVFSAFGAPSPFLPLLDVMCDSCLVCRLRGVSESASALCRDRAERNHRPVRRPLPCSPLRHPWSSLSSFLSSPSHLLADDAHAGSHHNPQGNFRPFMEVFENETKKSPPLNLLAAPPSSSTPSSSSSSSTPLSSSPSPSPANPLVLQALELREESSVLDPQYVAKSKAVQHKEAKRTEHKFVSRSLHRPTFCPVCKKVPSLSFRSMSLS